MSAMTTEKDPAPQDALPDPRPTPDQTPDGAPERAPRRRAGGWPTAVLLLALVGCLGFAVGGFLRFADTVTNLETPQDVGADAIVVLTGGSERVKKALELLADRRAERLLISGVHPDTTPEQIVRRTESDLALFACCIDLDREANNTLENAAETGKWARRNGFRTLLVVTSAYHMPRALLELRAVMPDLELVPAPVQSTDLALDGWYRDRGVSVLLAREYLKYMLAWVRIALMGPPEP